MRRFLRSHAGNPGRAGHRLSIDAARVIFEARECIASFIGISRPERVIFTHNATHAINTVLYGMLAKGDTVITSGIEHNAVMRPLRELEKKGVRLVIVPGTAEGGIDVQAFAQSITPAMRLAVICHASNVSGTVNDIAPVIAAAKRCSVPVLVDASQTAGLIPIHMENSGIDLLAFTGHKSMYGPTGTGCLCIHPSFDTSRLAPFMRGGTGSNSSEEHQPDDLPDRYESGTLNALGIAGLLAGVRFIERMTLERLLSHERRCAARLRDRLSGPGVRIFGAAAERSTGIISIRLDGMHAAAAAALLDDEFSILTRAGLHCAPAAHRAMGTFPHGTVRFSPGYSTSLRDSDAVVRAVRSIVKRASQ